MALSHSPRIITDGLVLCLDAGNTKSVPKTNILSPWTEYNGGSVHYEILGDYSVKLKNTSTAWIGYYPAIISVTGRYVLTFTYYADSNGSSLVLDNDGIMDNTYNTTLTANITPQTHTGIVDVTTTGNILHFLRRGSGGNIFITNVSYFKLESSWTDLSGNGNNGTLEGAGYNSANGGFLTFDGTDDYSDLGANSQLQSIGSNATIECWFKSTDVGSSRYGVMVGWGDGNNYYSNFGIGNWGSFSNYESIYLGYNSDVQCYVEENNSTYHDGNWHHAVTTIGSNNHKIFVDGIQKTLVFYRSDSYSVSNIFGYSAGTTINISRRQYGGGSGYFKGDIPVVKIYNRVLTDSEIQQNFNALRGRYGI